MGRWKRIVMQELGVMATARDVPSTLRRGRMRVNGRLGCVNGGLRWDRLRLKALEEPLDFTV